MGIVEKPCTPVWGFLYSGEIHIETFFINNLKPQLLNSIIPLAPSYPSDSSDLIG